MSRSCFVLFVAGSVACLSLSIPATAHTPGFKFTRVLNLKGTAVGEMREIPAIDGSGTTMGNCFDVDLFDANVGVKVGTATDCLADIEGVGDGLALIGTTYFNMWGGQFVSRGATSVQPMTHGSPGFTHLTAAVSPAGSNDVIDGSGWRFDGFEARVRLQGAVDMTNIADNEITFDCMFFVTEN